MVVLAIIGLIMLAVIPSINQLFSAGADAQAFNMLTAQLTAARARAIKSGNYTAVHVQLADNTAPNFAKLDGKCFLAIMEWNPNLPTGAAFVLADGFTPRAVPGGFAFGEIRDTFVDSGGFKNLPALDWSDAATVKNFTTFTVVFSPSGAAVQNIGADKAVFDDTHALFSSPPLPAPQTHMWDVDHANDNHSGAYNGEAAATAVTMFNHGDFTDAADRAVYLKDNAQFIPINVYTGQLFAR